MMKKKQEDTTKIKMHWHFFFYEIITVVQWLHLVISMLKEDRRENILYMCVCKTKQMIIKAFK